MLTTDFELPVHGCGHRTTAHRLLRRAFRYAFALVLLLVALAQPAAAQLRGPGVPGTESQPKQEKIEDPLGRTSPRGTVTSFLKAVDRDDFVSAARYMQVTENQRKDTEALARDLKTLIDRYFTQTLTSISDSPAGALDDGLPIDRERVGPLTIGQTKSDITLVRVSDPQWGPIWLISSETLAQVPALHAAVAKTLIERIMPGALLSRELFGISLAHWIVLASSLIVPFVVLTLIAGVSVVLARWVFRTPMRRRELDAWYVGTRWPLVTLLTLLSSPISLRFLGFALTFRVAYARMVLELAVVALAWLIRNVLTLGFARARNMVWGKDRLSTVSLMLLGERLVKALVLVVAIAAMLVIAGVDTKTALAGLGIVGVALALGAQKTVENLLGGVFLLSDKALAVGDTCSISNRIGTVEDVTLRSVRVRTLDQTLMSIPAGVLAQSAIENYATREKILMQTTLRLRYGTNVEQLKRILDDVRKLLDDDARLEAGTSRIRLIDFGQQAVELELFAYVTTTDAAKFLAVRESLLLAIATIVEAAGSAFAQPTQFIYMEHAPEDLKRGPRQIATR